MQVTIYLKDGSYIDDCLIDSITTDPKTGLITFTDRFDSVHSRKFSSIACIIIKGDASYEN